MIEQDSVTISFRDALRFISRGFLPALIVAAACAAAVYLISRNPTPVYRATAVLLATRPNSGYSDSANIIEPAQLDPDIYRSAVIEGGLMESALTAALGQQPTAEEMVEWRRAIRIRVDEGLISGLLRIEVEDEDAEQARRIANSLAQVLLGWDRDRVIMNVQETVAALRRSVLLIGAQLIAAEQAGNEDEALVLRATRDSRQTQLRQAETLSLSVVAIGLLEPFRDAVIDPRPVNDRTLFITVVAFVLAVLAVYLVMFFAAATSPRVRNSNDMLTAADEEPIIVLPPESRGPQFAAAVERLAVALQALRRPTGNDDTVPIGLVVAVASPTDPNEKSLMALYLAKAYMRAGLSVLVVDADFKYSVASQALPAPRGGPTLADLLQKGAGAQVASKVPGLATLEYIPAGARNGVGSSVSLARRMPGFINFWRSRYDVIIIDTPPSGDFPDAYSLANTVDAVVLLARAYMTPLDAYRTTVEVLEGSGAGSIFKVLSVGRRRRLPKASAELSSEWSDARGGAAPEAKVRVVSRSRG